MNKTMTWVNFKIFRNRGAQRLSIVGGVFLLSSLVLPLIGREIPYGTNGTTSTAGEIEGPAGQHISQVFTRLDGSSGELEINELVTDCNDVALEYLDHQRMNYFESENLGWGRNFSYSEEDPFLETLWSSFEENNQTFDTMENSYATNLILDFRYTEETRVTLKIDMSDHLETLPNGGAPSTINPELSQTLPTWAKMFFQDEEHLSFWSAENDTFGENNYPFYSRRSQMFTDGASVSVQPGKINIIPLDRIAPHLPITKIVALSDGFPASVCWRVLDNHTIDQIRDTSDYELVQVVSVSETTTSQFGGNESLSSDVLTSDTSENGLTAGSSGGGCISKTSPRDGGLGFLLLLITGLLIATRRKVFA